MKIINTQKNKYSTFEFGPWILILSGMLYSMPLCSSLFETANNNEDILFRALQDELKRSICELQLPKQERPYYIAYRVLDLKEVEIKASGGGLIASNEERSRELFVDLRVGSYQLDNSNFICPTFTSRIIESDRIQLPLEDEYLALRRAIWLVTDGTYKKALEVLAKKIAYFQNKQVNDTIPDFIKVKPCSLFEPIVHPVFDRSDLNKKITALSAVLNRYREIKESFVRFKLKSGNQYFIDSDGAKSVRGELITGIEVRAKAQAQNGTLIDDFIEFYSQGIDDLNFVKITEAINAWAETLTLKVNTRPEEESYSGPVLFLGPAACELFFQVLGKGVSGVRNAVIESEMLERSVSKENLGLFSNRLGRRILPEFISVFDDPNLKGYNDIKTIGGFSVDEQGVKSEKVELVKDGKLINFLMCRTPTNKIRTSNGHARYWSEIYVPRYIGFVSNLIIKSQKPVKEEELIKKLKEVAREYGNEYALIITRLQPTFPRTEYEQYQRFYQMRTKSIPILSSPVNIYKVDVHSDKIELIHGLDFAQVSLGILKDIIATGDREYVYNFIYRNEYGDEFPVSIAAPAVLVEDIELVPKKEKIEKPATVPRP
ncbi:MAG: metallopeptidase TldD-related protein [candidate division WOR-3 bacterium]|nr:metallopeptidase TldD-related protein [candidate division WOR-3 bacterium]